MTSVSRGVSPCDGCQYWMVMSNVVVFIAILTPCRAGDFSRRGYKTHHAVLRLKLAWGYQFGDSTVST